MSGYEVESSAYGDYVGEVLSMQFEINEYSGNPQAVFKMLTDDPEMPQWTERYNLGLTARKGTWSILDGGDEVVASDGSEKFRDNGGYGKFIVNAVKSAGIDPKTGKDKDGRQWGDTKKAQTWIGTIWYMKRHPGEFTDKDTQQVTTYNTNLPVEYKGMAADLDRPAHPAPGADGGDGAVGTSATTADLSSFPTLAELSAEQISGLMTAAKTEPHAKFMDSAMEICLESLTNEQSRGIFLTEISNPTGLYQTLRQ